MNWNEKKDEVFYILTTLCYLQAHNKSITSLIMLSEGTLLSGGEKDRKIIAWDSLQNYKKITETKVSVMTLTNYRSYLSYFKSDSRS